MVVKTDKNRLTSKKMKNKKFRKTEELIFGVVINCKDCFSVEFLTRKAKISRTTFYRHHRATHKILSEYENYLIYEYTRMIKPLLKKRNIKIRVIFFHTLIFIRNYKKLISILLIRKDNMFLRRILSRIKPKIITSYHIPKNANLLIDVYINEISGVIENWIRGGFSDDEMDKVLKSMIYLTETAKNRLIRLGN